MLSIIQKMFNVIKVRSFMDETIILYLLIGTIIFHFLLTQIVELFNLFYQPKNLPKEVEDIYTNDEYQRSKAYHKATTHFGFISTSISLIITIIVLVTGILGLFDDWLRQFINPNWLRGVIFLLSIGLISDLISVPLSLYQTFAIEARFGFNKTTITTFIIDKLKAYFLGALIGGSLISILLWLIGSIGQNFWLVFWMVVSAFSIFMGIFYSSLILPLFNKLTLLEEGELKSELKSLAQREGFNLKDIYIMDGSKRSTKANAFFTGLGKVKKIVLFDTLIDSMSIKEIVAVMAHEIGHYKKYHIPISLGLSVLQMGIILFLFSQVVFSPQISLALGGSQLSYHLNLIAFALLFTPVSLLISFLGNLLSRTFEFQADAFAARSSSPESMISALKKLASSNLANLVPHPFYVKMHYSHPPIISRLRAIARTRN